MVLDRGYLYTENFPNLLLENNDGRKVDGFGL